MPILASKENLPKMGEPPLNRTETMYLQITGFLPEPDPDDSLKFKRALGGDLEADALGIMDWKALEEAGGWETEVTPDQAKLFAKLLGEPQIVELTLFIGCVA